MTNKQLAEVILQKVGGRENIITYSHCSTRLRFDLKDVNAMDKTALEKTDGVLSVMEVAGQTQVVLGSKVQYVYEELQTIIPVGAANNSKEDADSKKGALGTILEIISNLFTPLIDVLIGAGILKGVISIFVAAGMLSTGSGTYAILNAAADSLYYFLPIMLAVTCSRRFKTNLFVSLTVAGALLYPDLTALYNAGTNITFLGIPVHLTAFKSSVFPIIFAILLLALVEKGLKKVLPDSIRSRLAPFFSLIIVVPVTIMVFGPLGSMLSNGIANVYMSLYDFNRIVAGGFIGAVAQVLVIFGIHWGLFPIIFSNIEKFGYDTILAVFGPSIIAQSGAAFGVYLKTKDKRLKEISAPAAVMGFFGISEPAIYGVTLKYRRAFVCAIIGGCIGGAISGAAGARAIAVAVAAVPTFPAYFGVGFTGFVVGYFGAFIISAVLTYLFGFNDSMISEEDRYAEKTELIEENASALSGVVIRTAAPVKGRVIPLNQVKDNAFASEALGKGAAIIPASNQVLSPIAGTVTVVYSTKHAIGITGAQGEEFLIHIGVDTVKLGGKYFEAHVKEGDIVMPGDILVTVDFAAIEKEGYDPTVIVVDTTEPESRAVTLLKTGEITPSEEWFLVESK